MATTVKPVTQVIKNIIQVKDVSLKSLDKQHIPIYLWKELQNAKKEIPVTPVTPTKVESPKEKVESTEPEKEEETPQMSDYDKYVLYNLKYGVLDYSDWERQYPSYWEEQIERLERRRSVFNRKRGWSAKDEYEVNSIDRKLEYCHNRLEDTKQNKTMYGQAEYDDESYEFDEYEESTNESI